MKMLNIEFQGRGEVKGYHFQLIKYSEFAYVYKVSYAGSVHYEVFSKKINTRFNRISYPTKKAFGVWAWTCMSLDKSIQKFDELNNKVYGTREYF